MYGYAYLKTGRIEAAVFAHLILNITHFLFFAYPYAI
jgi:membrane protease YdiL (CAAX protease family)